MFYSQTCLKIATVKFEIGILVNRKKNILNKCQESCISSKWKLLTFLKGEINELWLIASRSANSHQLTKNTRLVDCARGESPMPLHFLFPLFKVKFKISRATLV